MAEKGDMIVDINPFGISIDMVPISTAWKEQTSSKVPRWEKKLKEKDKIGPSRKAI